ncbi:hypothetical protein FKM82_008095 [Ascaphus truei]
MEFCHILFGGQIQRMSPYGSGSYPHILQRINTETIVCVPSLYINDALAVYSKIMVQCPENKVKNYCNID